MLSSYGSSFLKGNRSTGSMTELPHTLRLSSSVVRLCQLGATPTCPQSYPLRESAFQSEHRRHGLLLHLRPGQSHGHQ